MPIQVTNWLIQPEVGNRARVTLCDRDRALEIQDEQIPLVGDGYDLLGKERTGRVYDQATGHLASIVSPASATFIVRQERWTRLHVTREPVSSRFSRGLQRSGLFEQMRRSGNDDQTA